MAHHDNSLFLDSSLFASCPDLFPELLDLPAQAEPFGAPLGTDHLLATHSAHWTRDDPTPLASPPASSQASVASPVSSFDALWDAAALPVLDDPFFDFGCPAATGAATTTATATATTTSAATAAPAPTPGQPQAGRSARGPGTPTLTTTLPLLLTTTTTTTTTSAAPAGPHKEQHRATRTCSGCGLEKKRVYRYLGASAPFCNACNQHWRRHLHECPLCLKLRALNATEELRGTDITHLDGPARPRRRDPRPDALACASPHVSHDPHRPLHSGPLRRRPAHVHVHAPAPALHRPYAFCS